MIFQKEWDEFQQNLKQSFVEGTAPVDQDQRNSWYQKKSHDFFKEIGNRGFADLMEDIEDLNRTYLYAVETSINKVDAEWHRALCGYRAFVLADFRYTREFEALLESKAQEQDFSNNHVLRVMAFINGRALLVANEIHSLIQNGYADAAHARFRMMYELAIIGMFIVKHGNDTAKEFMDYRGEWYEWAAAPIRKERPRFHDIVKNVQSEEANEAWLTIIGLSDQMVHASTHAIFGRISLQEDSEDIPADSSVYGLAQPAMNTLQVLFHISKLYFSQLHDNAMYMHQAILYKIKEHASDEFYAVAKRHDKMLEKDND